MRLLALPLLLAVISTPVFAQQEVAIAGLTLTLPDDWTGAVERNESRAPRQASYTFDNTNAESSLSGSRLIVYRVTGLNGLDRHQWWRGTLAFGYEGARPIAAITPDEMVFVQATGYRTEGNGRLGAIYFTQHGPAFYAIHFSAPADVFEEQLPALLDVARTIRFSSTGTGS